MRKEDVMVYSFEVIKHANMRYREAVIRLGIAELQTMLGALSRDCTVSHETLGGSSFLTFETDPLSEADLAFLRRHSSICFFAEKKNGGLFPVSPPSVDYLPEELPEVLKYKGKTSSAFTRFMMNTAVSLSSFALSPDPLTVLDPLCGKGTTLFSAAQLGMNTVGLDTDRKAIREAADFFSRFLKLHGLKHTLQNRSETAGHASVPVTGFEFADTKEHYQAGQTRSMLLAVGDTSLSPALVRKRRAHCIVADLPYGIQHAPQGERRPESFQSLLGRSLPFWRKSLHPGGVLALSFNTLTLRSESVLQLVSRAGFVPCRNEVFSALTHEVEQAVVRDVVFAVNQKEDVSL